MLGKLKISSSPILIFLYICGFALCNHYSFAIIDVCDCTKENPSHGYPHNDSKCYICSLIADDVDDFTYAYPHLPAYFVFNLEKNYQRISYLLKGDNAVTESAAFIDLERGPPKV
jgi:hypothetical protein